MKTKTYILIILLCGGVVFFKKHKDSTNALKASPILFKSNPNLREEVLYAKEFKKSKNKIETKKSDQNIILNIEKQLVNLNDCTVFSFSLLTEKISNISLEKSLNLDYFSNPTCSEKLDNNMECKPNVTYNYYFKAKNSSDSVLNVRLVGTSIEKEINIKVTSDQVITNQINLRLTGPEKIYGGECSGPFYYGFESKLMEMKIPISFYTEYYIDATPGVVLFDSNACATPIKKIFPFTSGGGGTFYIKTSNVGTSNIQYFYKNNIIVNIDLSIIKTPEVVLEIREKENKLNKILVSVDKSKLKDKNINFFLSGLKSLKEQGENINNDEKKIVIDSLIFLLEKK